MPQAGPTATGEVLLAVAAAGLLVAAVVQGRRALRRNPADVTRSQLLFAWAKVAVLVAVALMLLTVAVPSLWLIAGWGLLLPALLASAGKAQQLLEQYQVRVEHKALGLPGLRRRLHWGWAAASGFVVGIAATLGLFWAAVLLSGEPPETNRADGGFTLIGWLIFSPGLVLPILFGYVQYVRHRRRDRDIRTGDLRGSGLELIAPANAPAWVPQSAESHWHVTAAAIDAPVPADKAWRVLLRCLGINGCIVAIGVVLAVSTGPGGSLADALVIRILAGVGVIVLGTITFAPFSLQGVRTASRHLRQHAP